MQITAFPKALDGFSGFRATTTALRLTRVTLVTFVRTVVLRAYERLKIDFDCADRCIPAKR